MHFAKTFLIHPPYEVLHEYVESGKIPPSISCYLAADTCLFFNTSSVYILLFTKILKHQKRAKITVGTVDRSKSIFLVKTFHLGSKCPK